MAVNCSVSPLAIEGLAGVTAIDTATSPRVTVSVSFGLPEMAPLNAAEMNVVLPATQLSSPIPVRPRHC